MRLHLITSDGHESVSLASLGQSASIKQHVVCDITVNDRVYKSVTFRVMENLCVDVILGNEFQRLHKSVTFEYGTLMVLLIFVDFYL